VTHPISTNNSKLFATSNTTTDPIVSTIAPPPSLPVPVPPPPSFARTTMLTCPAREVSPIAPTSPVGILPPFPKQQQQPCFEVPVTATTADSFTTSGAVVAAAFVSTVGAAADNLLDEWLSYYSPTAIKGLLVGGAQATCHSPLERQQQWQSLLLRDSCVWEGHGWTVQPASCSNNNTITTSVLMVLTSRTL
jgi:hypothetical protein